MINCLEKLGTEKDKYFLSLLRVERNTRAHSNILTKPERRRLYNLSPFLGDLYIRYIVTYEKKNRELFTT